jgi:hypothetical protein
MSDSYKEVIKNLTPYDPNRLNYNNKFNPTRQKNYKPPSSGSFKKPPVNFENSPTVTNDITKIMKILKNKSAEKSAEKNEKNEDKSPNKNSHTEQSDDSSKETKIILLKIFMNISNFNKDENCYYLSYRALSNFLKNINLVNEKELKLTDVDIMLQKINPNGNRLNSENFLDLILHIAEFLDKNFFENPKISVTNLVKKYFENFAKNLENFENNKNDKNDKFLSTISSSNHPKNENNIILNNYQNLENFILNFSLNEEIKEILNSVYFALKEIYLTYFHYENNNYTDRERIIQGSYENLIELGKDFGFIPYIFSMKQISIYWNLIINTSLEEMLNNSIQEMFSQKNKSDFGAIFTFLKFSLMLIHFSILSYNKKHANPKNSEKVIYFFEKLESSSGFENFYKKSGKSQNSKFKLVPSKDLIEKINPNILIRRNFEKIDPIEFDYTVNNTINNQMTIEFKKSNFRRKSTENFTNLKILKNYNNNTEKYSLRDIMLINEENFSKLENDLENFREIFQSYSKIGGDKLTFNKINYSSFLRFMKDSKLMINEREHDINSDMNLNKLNVKKRRSTSTKTTSARRTISNNDNKLLNDTEVCDIFTNLTGNKNFDHPTAKSQLDSNPGLTATFGKALKRTTLIDPSYLLKMKTHNVPNKMDFYLFVKSFELIAMKIYNVIGDLDLDLDEAFRLFYENKVPVIFANFRKKFSLSLDKGEKLGVKERLDIVRNEMVGEFIFEIIF